MVISDPKQCFLAGPNAKVNCCTQNGHPAKGHYSQIAKGGPFISLSSQLPLSLDGGLVEGDIGVQARQVFANIKDMLKEGGSSLEKGVRMGVYIADIDDL